MTFHQTEAEFESPTHLFPSTEGRMERAECNLQASATLRAQSKHLFRTLKRKLTTEGGGQEEGMCVHTVKNMYTKPEYNPSKPQLNNMIPNLML